LNHATITIRPAGLSDVPAVTRLWDEFMKHQANLVARENPSSKPYWIRRPGHLRSYQYWARKNIRSNTGSVLIAEVDGQMAGYSLFFILTPPPVFQVRRLGHIGELFVKEKYRGLGIGSRLYEEAVGWFRRKRIKHLSLVVIKGNDLPHSIYKKWGFFDNFVEMRKKL
jgi:GNAT superfamily N-acetyltransferase